MINSKDCCITLEMAQRPELRAAMESAGLDAPMAWWCGGEDMGWFIVVVNLCSNSAYMHHPPAYHLGELWAAAVKLAAERHPDKIGSVGLEWVHPNCGQDDHALYGADVLGWDGYGLHKSEDQTHAPDALAELVIALHAAQNLHTDSSERTDG